MDVTVRPRLRGILHVYAFFAAVIAGAALVLVADSGRERLAMGIYALSLAAMFGVSGLYHRVVWRSSSARMWLRRLDHTTIPLLIAGTYTPFALLAFRGTTANVVLLVVWAGAAAGLLLNLAWIGAPKWVSALVFIALGWVGVLALPQLVDLGVAPALLVIGGGVLYTLGALTYAFNRPDPSPLVFGYHEVFHLLVVGAAAAHFVAIAGFVLQDG